MNEPAQVTPPRVIVALNIRCVCDSDRSPKKKEGAMASMGPDDPIEDDQVICEAIFRYVWKSSCFAHQGAQKTRKDRALQMPGTELAMIRDARRIRPPKRSNEIVKEGTRVD